MKDIILFLILVPVTLSFIIVVWAILFSLIKMMVDAIKDWKRFR